MKFLPLLLISLTILSTQGGFIVPIYHSGSNVLTRRQLFNSTNPLGALSSSASSTAFGIVMNIQMGSNNQAIQNVVVDTGSSPLWVVEASCVCTSNNNLGSSVSGCPGSTISSNSPTCAKSLFSSTSSSTFKDVSATEGTFTGQYGDGTTAKGPYSQDTVTIGSLQITSYTFGLINSVVIPSGVGSSNGIMGWAPQENGFASSILSVLHSDTAIAIKQFSFYYPPTLTSAGELFIGGADSSKFSGTPVEIPITFQNYWSVASGSVNAVSASGVKSGTGSTAIIDTGTSFVLGPLADVKNICSWLGLAFVPTGCSSGYVTATECSFGTPSNGNCLSGSSVTQGSCLSGTPTSGACHDFCCGTQADCSSQAAPIKNYVHLNNLPNFNISFGGGISLPVNIKDNFFLPTGTLGGNPLTCSLAIQGHASSNAASSWIIGASFIRQYYAIFDFTGYISGSTAGAYAGSGMVGFANRGSGGLDIIGNNPDIAISTQLVAAIAAGVIAFTIIMSLIFSKLCARKKPGRPPLNTTQNPMGNTDIRSTPTLNTANPIRESIRGPIGLAPGTYAQPRAVSMKPEPPLPQGWTKEFDASSNHFYYFHAARDLTQWNRPDATQ